MSVNWDKVRERNMLLTPMYAGEAVASFRGVPVRVADPIKISDTEFYENFMRSISAYRSKYGEYPESIECDPESFITLRNEVAKRNQFWLEGNGPGNLKINGVEIIVVRE